MIKEVKLDCEGDINCTFTIIRDDGSVHDYWSCDTGTPDECDGGPDLSKEEVRLLFDLWNHTTISPAPVNDDENWKRDFSEWELVGDVFVKTKEWSEECC